MIPEKTKQEILETAQIEEVIEEFVQLKRAGTNLKGLCPFHDEKTPSFVVSPSKNIFKCFGCGRGGDSVTFLMEHETLGFPEALRYLAKKYNIKIEEIQLSKEGEEEKKLLDSLFIINDFALEFFQRQLKETDKGKSIGLSYFKERKFRNETIDNFGLGYAPKGPDTLTQEAIKKGYKKEFLKKLGLTTAHDRDFFRERVIFPIHNLTGKVVAFAGRILDKNIKAPKYINSPETDIYHKSNILYGLYFAKRAIRKHDECLLVEGYTDVISLHQSGIEHVVASSGTSLTTGQIRLIKRHTSNIKILYDGDPAGIQAALRGVDLILEQDLNAKIVLLPDGEDPDSYLQKVGAKAFEDYLNREADDFVLFKAKLLLKGAASDPIKKVAMVRDILETIAIIPDPIKRSVYIKECTNLLNVEEPILVEELNKIILKNLNKKKPKREERAAPAPPEITVARPGAAAPSLSIDEKLEKEVARILISFGGEMFDPDENLTVAGYVLSNIEEIMDDFESVIYGRITKECLDLLVENKPISHKHFLHHSSSEIQQLAIEFLQMRHEYSPNWEKMWDIVLQTQPMPDKNFSLDSKNVLLRFKLRKFIRSCEENQQFIKKLQDSGRSEKMITRLKVQKELLDRRNELAGQLKIVVLK